MRGGTWGVRSRKEQRGTGTPKKGAKGRLMGKVQEQEKWRPGL